MISKQEILQLEKNKSFKSPVLSLYLNTDKKYAEGENFLGQLRHILKEADKQIKATFKNPLPIQRKLHEEIVPKILDFLDKEVEDVPSIRSIAFFASLVPTRTPLGSVISYTLPRPVRSQARLHQKPFIRPLLFLFDQYENYGIIVANQQHARFILVSLGEMQHVAEFVSNAPHRHDQGGWAQKKFERRADNAIKKHVQQIVKYAANFLKNTETERLILSGDEDIVHLIKENLGPNDLKKVVGALPSVPHETAFDTLERALKVMAKAESEGETAAVQELYENLNHPGKAVAGLKDVLDAVNKKNVQKLVLKKGYHALGSYCPNCSTISGPSRSCSNCGTSTNTIEDILEVACELVYLEQGKIEFVVESMDLEAMGNVGALLRY